MRKTQANISLRFYQDIVKRLLDLITSLIFLLLLLAPGVVIAILIKLTSPGPVFFKQIRVGKNGQLFKIFKFRSMTIDAPHQKATAEFFDANHYITGIGRFLRKTSIDELPQLWNVFKGDMSVVGPRPLIPAENQINHQRHALKIDRVLPGITGLAQVNGRDRLTNRDKLKYDYYYCQHLSLDLDFQIVVKTVVNVLTSKDIQDGQQ